MAGEDAVNFARLVAAGTRHIIMGEDISFLDTAQRSIPLFTYVSFTSFP